MSTISRVRRARINLADVYDFVVIWAIRLVGTMLVFISAVYGCLELFGLLPELSDKQEAILDLDKARELNVALTPEDEIEEDPFCSTASKRGAA